MQSEIPSDLRIKFSIKDAFFGVNFPKKPSAIQKVQLHLLDILIGNLQLSIFTCHNHQQSKNLTGQHGSIKQIWNNKMCKSTNLLISATNKRKPLKFWNFRYNRKLEYSVQSDWNTTLEKIVSYTIKRLLKPDANSV